MSSRLASSTPTLGSDFGTNSMASHVHSPRNVAAIWGSGTLFPMARWCTSASANAMSAGPRSFSESRSRLSHPIDGLGLVRSMTSGSRLRWPFETTSR